MDRSKPDSTPGAQAASGHGHGTPHRRLRRAVRVTAPFLLGISSALVLFAPLAAGIAGPHDAVGIMLALGAGATAMALCVAGMVLAGLQLPGAHDTGRMTVLALGLVFCALMLAAHVVSLLVLLG